jgi:hypothetical protein
MAAVTSVAIWLKQNSRPWLLHLATGFVAVGCSVLVSWLLRPDPESFQKVCILHQKGSWKVGFPVDSNAEESLCNKVRDLLHPLDASEAHKIIEVEKGCIGRYYLENLKMWSLQEDKCKW